MKILHISYIETNAGWGAECFVDETLEKIEEVELMKLDFKKHPYEIANMIMQYEDFDIVFLQRGDWFPLQVLKAINRPKVFWASELISRNVDQNRLLFSNQFDHIFVHSNLCNQFMKKNLKKMNCTTSVLLNGFDSKLHRKLDLEKDIDVLFVGGITDRRKKELNKLKLKVDITICENVFGKEFVNLINRAKIVVNIHSAKHLDTETRVFEVLGCGTFLLSERLSDENPFTPGVHYMEAELSTFPEMIRYYLSNEEERENIALAGHMEALNKHSWEKRTIRDIYPELKRISDETRCDSAYDRDKLQRFQNICNKKAYQLLNKCYLRLMWYVQRLFDIVNRK